MIEIQAGYLLNIFLEHHHHNYHRLHLLLLLVVVVVVAAAAAAAGAKSQWPCSRRHGRVAIPLLGLWF